MKKNSQQIINFAQNILSIEAEEISNAKSKIDEKFVELTKLILFLQGKNSFEWNGKIWPYC